MSRSTEILFNGTYCSLFWATFNFTTGRGYRYRFQSTLAFEPYKPLIDQELKLLEGLALTLRCPSQAKSTELFLLHIGGEMARFKAVFDWPLAFPKAKAYLKLSFWQSTSPNLTARCVYNSQSWRVFRETAFSTTSYFLSRFNCHETSYWKAGRPRRFGPNPRPDRERRFPSGESRD